MKKNKKSFTLVEMLIVIVIIGILAAALIPKLQDTQARARDTARKVATQQLGAGLAVYKSDHSSYFSLLPLSGGDLTATLVTSGGYLTSLPKDPTSTRTLAGELTGATALSVGNFAYKVISTNTADDAGSIVIGAFTETPGTSSNAINTGGAVASSTILSNFITNRICTSTVTKGATTTTACNGVAADYRYYYAQ